MPGDEGSTKHEPVGQWGTGFQPTVGAHVQFTPVQYANYGPMLQAIEAAGSNILNYLNPSTIAKMKLDVASSQAGRNWLEWIQRPENRDMYFRTQAGISGGNFEMVPGYSNPFLRTGEIKTPTDGNGNQNRVNETTVAPNQQNPNQQNPVAQQNPVVPKNPYDYFANPNTGTLQFQEGGPVPWYEETHFGGQGVAQPTPRPQPTPVPQPIQPARTPTYFGGQPAENNLFANANAVPPPPPPAQVQAAAPQPGALPAHIPYSPESQAQALAPPQVGASPEELSRRQQEQQNLIAWQNQSQGGVMSASEARDWAKNAIDTDITRAVYLPHGGPVGPNGQKEPAYAFYGKKAGAANIVPISQMVKAGAGPLVAAQNISQVLSAPELSQPQNQPQATPQATPQQQPQPGMAGGGGPPAAPGQNVAGQLPQDEFARRVAAATNVPNAGGPPVSQLTAGTNQSGTVNTGAENFPDASEIKPMEDNYAKNGSSRFNDRGDPYIGTSFNGWDWYKSDNGKGLSYVERPGAGGFLRQRYYLGDDHWESITPPEQAMRQSLFEAMPQLGYDAIKNMSADELQNHLSAYWNMKNLHDMSAQDNQQLNDDRQHILSLTRVLDAVKDRGPEAFNATAQWENAQAHNLGGRYTQNPSTPAEYANNLLALGLGALTTGGKRIDPDVTFVRNEYDKLLRNQVGLKEGAPMTDGQIQSADANLGGLLSGQPDALQGLTRQLDDAKAAFRQRVLGAIANNQKISGIYTDLNDDITAGRPFWDKDGYHGQKGKPGPGVEQDSLQTAKGTHVTPSATPAPAAPGPSATPGTGPGSSQANPLHIHSDQEYYSAHGVWVADDHDPPRVRFKP